MFSTEALDYFSVDPSTGEISFTGEDDLELEGLPVEGEVGLVIRVRRGRREKKIKRKQCISCSD